MGNIKVSSKSNASSVAGAIAAMLREDAKLEIHTVGAGALNQAMKGVAIARGFLAPIGADLTVSPAFAEVKINDEIRTGIKLSVEKHIL